MTYAAKGEKVFLYQDPMYPDCTPPGPRRSDHRLKRFQSTTDRRAWSFCEEVQSKHFRDLFSGSRTCLGVDQCHKYVPLEDLLRILMAGREQQDQFSKDSAGADQQSSKKQQEAGAGDKELLQSEIAGLTEEVNKSRDMLRKAMHKLENIDEIVNENKKLQCRLRCSEERVKYLEERKRNLEGEIAALRSKSQIQMDLDRAQDRLSRVQQQREESKETDEAFLQGLALERDELQEKVKKLEKELEESKKTEAEIVMLKKQSESDSLDREDLSRENECFRKKLASMKCLEKQIQELKKQGRSLADKYKKEAQKAAEQMGKMCQAARELQALREERDSLRKRVNELSSYECRYNKLQRKLQRVDAVIAENETLNSKLLALQKLEKENEYLRCRLEAIQEMEMSAADDKERITQLQCEVADQEEEMKDLLCQIERLTSGRNEEELQRLRCELLEKNSKLKLCEQQLAEIPMLEAEIDELRMKLQCCCREFPEKKRGESNYQKVEVRFPASSTGIRANYKTPAEKCSSILGVRREEKVELKENHARCQEIPQAYKAASEMKQTTEVMSCEEVQRLLQSSKGIISCVLEDMIEHQKEMEELETCNKTMKEEIEALKAKVGGSDKDCLLREISDLKREVEEKNQQISRLRQSGAAGQDGEETATLRELNNQLKTELEAACAGLKQVGNLEKMLEEEREARCAAERRLRDEGAGVSGEARGVAEEDAEFDCCRALQRETDDLKLQIVALNKLTEELKKENELLRELQKPCPDFSKELDEKCALENLLSLLQAELDAYKGQKLSDECEALRKELKRVMELNCQLKALVACYRERLDLEKQDVAGERKVPTKTEDTVDSQKEPEQLIKEEDQFEKELGQVRKEKSIQSGTAEATDGQKELEEPRKQLEQAKEEKSNQAGTAEATDCQKELEQLRKQLEQVKKEKEEIAKNLEKGPAGMADCLKELEELRREKERLGQQLEQAKKEKTNQAGTAEPTDCQKELEQLRKQLEEAKKEKSNQAGTAEPTDCQKELEQLRKQLEEAKKEKSNQAGTAEATDCQKELEQLRKQLEEAKKEKTNQAGTAEATDCQKELEQLRKQLEQVKKEKEEIAKNLEKGSAGMADCLKELEELRREKERLGQQLEQAKKEKTNQAGTAEATDCQKELEQLRKQLEQVKKEKEEIAKNLEKGSAGMADCLKELEELRREKERLGQQLEQAKKEKTNQAGTAEATDCQKELEQLRKQLEQVKKEKEEIAKNLEKGPAGMADCLKQLEELKKAKDRLETQLQEAKGGQGKTTDDLEARIRQMEAENAEKLKKLMDQHEKELADRDKTYKDNLSAMKSGYETDIRKMADRHKQSIQKLQDLHEDEVQEMNLNYENQMESPSQKRQEAPGEELLRLKAQHEREMQKVRRASKQKLDALKETLKEERRKSAATVESLKAADQGKGEGVCNCKYSRKKPPKPRDPSCPLDFNEVLEKILEEGLDCLTFNEIALVHRKTCCALERMVMNSSRGSILEMEPPVGDGCPRTPLLEADKQQLLGKIFALESEIAQKQKQTEEAIINMEVAIKKERCRLQEVRNSLQKEQQKNVELKLLLSSQTKLQEDLKKERDRLGSQASVHQLLCREKSKQLDEEMRNQKCLKAEVDRLRDTLKQMSTAMDADRGNSNARQGDEVELLRLKLQQAIHHERRLTLQLENEAKCRMQLQCQLQTLRQSLKHMVNLPAVEDIGRGSQNPLEAKSAKNRKNLDQINEKKNKIKTKPVKKHKK